MDPWVYPPRSKVPSWIWIRCIYSATYRNTFMSPLTFVMSSSTRNSAQTFSYFIPPNSVGDHHSSLSHCYRTTLMADYIIPVLIQQQNLSITVAMQIPHRHLAALFHLYSAYLFWRHLFLTPKSMGLRTTGWTPNACSSPFNCFLPTMTTSTKATSQLKPLLNF